MKEIILVAIALLAMTTTVSANSQLMIVDGSRSLISEETRTLQRMKRKNSDRMARELFFRITTPAKASIELRGGSGGEIIDLDKEEEKKSEDEKNQEVVDQIESKKIKVDTPVDSSLLR